MDMTLATRAHQAGATLIVALVFLVVLTIAGITAMQFSTMEERMASNSQFRNETFQQAQSSIQSNLIALNANATGRARLLEAMNQEKYNAGTGSYPIKLSDTERGQLGLPETVTRAVDAPEAQTSNDGFSVIRNTTTGIPCEGPPEDVSSAITFECTNYELQIKEELPNGAYSDQSQGLMFMNVKAKS